MVSSSSTVFNWLRLRLSYRKIVNSVWVNVVNTGSDLGGIPIEVEDVHVHPLSVDNFSASSMGIFRSKGDLMRSSHFFGDITAWWVLTHFYSRFQVSVGRDVVFDKTLGKEDEKLRYLVAGKCVDTYSC